MSLELRTASRFGAPIAAVFVAVVVRLALEPVLGVNSPYLPFAFAVLIAARFAGRLGGIVATTLSGVAVMFVFLEPRYSFRVASPHAVAGLLLFVLIGCLISLLVGQLRQALLATARAEERLREQLDLVDLSHDAIIGTDAERRITAWNRGAAEMYGWKEEEALGKVVHEFLQSRSHVSTTDINAILLRDERWDGELQQVARDGRMLQVESRLVLRRDRHNRAVSILEINRDITARQAAEGALRQSEKRYRTLFESMEEGFTIGEMICNPAGQPVDWRYLEVNPAQAAMLRLGRGQIIGHTYREIFPAAAWQRWVEGFGKVALTGVPTRLNEYGEGTGRHYHAVVYSPAPGLFAAVQTDVTETRMAEERLRAAQKWESIGVLAGGVAHDFNNILTVIMGSASAASLECATCQHSKSILAASERAAHLVRQLMAYAGKDHHVTEVFNLTEAVAQSKQILLASVPKRARVTFRLAPDLAPLEADPSRIEQVLMNLVINAGEAIPAHTDGRIDINTFNFEVTAEIARRQQPAFSVEAGPHVCLEVHDTGAGMDSATLTRIFDPFFSTKFTGRGLGLAAVHGVVRACKGFIEVQSTPGLGSTFRVFLPASARKYAASARQAVAAPRRAGSSCRILIVDDEEMVRRLARFVLKQQGYEVLEAEDGQEALQTIAHSCPLPSLVLLDLAMPVMGGDQFLPILRERYPAIKVLISSGYPEEEARNSLPPDAVDAFLPKPYDNVTLVEKVRETLA